MMLYRRLAALFLAMLVALAIIGPAPAGWVPWSRYQTLYAATPWSGIIDSSRATDWSVAGATISHATTACATVTSASSVATINSAIASCTAGQYVHFSGTGFSLNNTLDVKRSDITLRGDGPMASKLSFTGSNSSGCGIFYDPAIRVCPPSNNYGRSDGGFSGPQHTATWTAGYSQGATSVTLSSTTGLEAGSVIFLDQLDDTVTDGVTDGYPGAGDLLDCSSTQPCSADGGTGFARSGRSHTEVHEVTAVNSGTGVVTISPGIRAPNYRSGQTPGAWWGNLSGGSIGTIANIGIEDMTIDFTGANTPSFGGPGVLMIGVKNAWIKNVRLLNTNTSPGSFVLHVDMVNSFRTTVRDSYFYGYRGTSSDNPNMNYAYTTQICGSCLLENNIFHHNPSPIIPNDPESGSVYAYNLTEDAWYSSSGLQQHNSGDYLNLFEGNDVGQLYNDNNHGTHHFNTLFRNLFSRNTHNQNGGGNASGVTLLTHARFYNILNNVFGNASWTVYETNLADSSASIFDLGDVGNCSNCGSMPLDANVKRTLFRYGNWDNVNSSNDNGTNDQTGTRFNTGEVPSGIANYPNAVPASQTFPASFYLTACPATWWVTAYGTPAWPPIGVDVSNSDLATGYGGHANKIPARLVFDNLAVDSAYAGMSPQPRQFDAATAYPGGTCGGSQSTTPQRFRFIRVAAIPGLLLPLGLAWYADTKRHRRAA